MKFTSRVKNAFNAFSSSKAENGISNTAADFLRYGNKGSTPMLQDWSQVEMSDQDMYTGYSYAAIKKRANRASALGKGFLYTEASSAVMDAAKKADKELEHPYLALIRKSKDFTTRKFWHDISTYLDLEGVYYLMAVRAIGQPDSEGIPKVGAVQKFVMLNPYQVRRVRKDATGELGGYIESRDGKYREIPKEMIIEIRLLNPFDNETPYSMTDAAKESQFTMKQAGDYTRHSIRGNINAPGAITTDVVLEDHIFDNFVSRIQNHSKGEPLYGNGAGAINWASMQIDLDKASLDKINEIHRSILFAVSGTSKTTLGIEESGTTRDTSQVQKDNFTEDAVMPQIEDIIDALNLDYRKYYPEWENNEYEILLDNPLETNREAELKDIEIRDSELNLRETLVSMGYEYEIAGKYAHGDISLEELGEPTLEPELTPDMADAIAAREAGLDTTPTAGGAQPPMGSGGGGNAPQSGNPAAPTGRQDPAVTPRNNPKLDPAAARLNFVTTTNKFVKPDHNEKQLKEARKRIAERLKAEKAAAKDAKKAETPAATIAGAQDLLDKGLEDKIKKDGTLDIEAQYTSIKPLVDGSASIIFKTSPADEAKMAELLYYYRKHGKLSFTSDDGQELSVDTEAEAVNAIRNHVMNHSTQKVENQIAARDFPNLYDDMAIDVDKLGCIMMSTVKIPVAQYVPDSADDLYTETRYDQDALVGEVKPHVTLLFGLLQNGNVWKDKVDMLLEGWSLPKLKIEKVSYFDLGTSYAIVALIEKTPELVDGHERLTLLPHVNTFSEYHPHVTLAYIKHDVDPEKWVAPLNKKYKGQIVATTELDYGDKPDSNKKNNKAEAVLNLAYPVHGKAAADTADKESSSGSTSNVEAPHEHDCSEHESAINSTLEKAKNALEDGTRDAVELQESGLFTNISQLEAQIAMKLMNAIQNGNIENPEKLLTKAELKGYTNELAAYLAAFFTVIFPVYAGQLMANRLAEFNTQGIFAMTDDVQKYIKFSATNAAESHVSTVMSDLAKAVTEAHDAQTQVSLVNFVESAVRRQDKKTLRRLPQNPNREDIVKAVKEGKFDGDPIYKLARDAARQGNGLDAITRELRKKYANISKNRARTIARHETNRVFNMAQYQADLQFLTESGLMESAYKRMYNRANDPCPFCAKVIDQTNSNPIPFAQNFLELGDELSAAHQLANGKMSVRTMSINYESIKAGNLHVNCRCEYELIIKREDGTFQNAAFDYSKVKNFNPNHDKIGRFGKGDGSTPASFKPKKLVSMTDMDEYERQYEAIVTEDEGRVVSHYVMHPSSFNRLPRKDPEYSELPEQAKKEALTNIAKLDSAINKSTLKDDLVLWRGSEAGDVFDNPADMKVGNVITDGGFVSTSLNVDYSKENFAKDFIFKINAPKGAKGLMVNTNTISKGWNSQEQKQTDGWNPMMIEEHEVLLPRGGAFQIKNVEKKTEQIFNPERGVMENRTLTNVELDYIGTTQ